MGGGGITAGAEGTSLLGGSRGVIAQKTFKFGGSKTLATALVRIDVIDVIDVIDARKKNRGNVLKVARKRKS